MDKVIIIGSDYSLEQNFDQDTSTLQTNQLKIDRKGYSSPQDIAPSD